MIVKEKKPHNNGETLIKPGMLKGIYLYVKKDCVGKDIQQENGKDFILEFYDETTH